MVGLPLTLASAASESSHWQRIYTAEKIRASGLSVDSGETQEALEIRRDSHARSSAIHRMEEYADSVEGRDAIAAHVCRFLMTALNHRGFGGAAEELLRQGSVLTWSALEILSRDLFEHLLNADPKRILPILNEPSAKSRLPSKFTLEELATVGFDLSTSLGSHLASQQDFSDIRTIKAIMAPILGGYRGVSEALSDSALRVLCQQRHLIVHRRGIVDAKYLEASGENRSTGEYLAISPAELEYRIERVLIAGYQLLSAATNLVE